MEGKLIKLDEGYVLVDDKSNALGQTFGKFKGKKLSLKNCEVVKNGYDLDELADTFYMKFENQIENPALFYRYFKLIFPEALSILGDKKFSEEDVISMIEKSRETGLTSEYLILTKQQTEWDVRIEMECVMGCQNLILNGENSVCCGDKKPKLDADGCLILRRI